MSSMFRSRSLLVGLLLCAAGALAQACGDDDDGAASSPDAGGAVVPEASAPAAVSTPTQATQQVGAAGGSVMTTTGTGVEIPANALTGNVGITVAQSASTQVSGAVGTAFQLGPSGLLFATPATVVIEFDPTKIPSGKTAADVVVLTAPDGTTNFSVLATSVRDATHVAAQTSHFSLFVPAVSPMLDSGTTTTLDSGTTGTNDDDAGGGGSDASVAHDASVVLDSGGGGASDASRTETDAGGGASDASVETDGGSVASDAAP